jgi:hypothetical protein
MTKKIYKTAMGKTVDLGSLVLQNEHVRAVGNMGVNARGDILDSADRVIDKKSKQIQRQYDRQIKNTVQDQPVHTSTLTAKQTPVQEQYDVAPTDIVEEPAIEINSTPAAVGGLASAMAKSRLSKSTASEIK